MATLADLLTSKIPPHNLEVERAVLGSLLVDNDALPRVLERHLGRDDFYKEGHRKIFDAVIRCTSGGHAVDVLILSEALRQAGELEEVGGPAALAQLLDEAALLTRVKAYADVVREHATRRGLIALSTDMIGRAYENGVPAADLVARATRELEGLTRAASPANVTWPLYDGADPWDFPPITYLVDELLPAKGLVWWGGLSKRCKSLLLLYVCLCIAARRVTVAGHFMIRGAPKILFVSQEDGGSRVQTRRDDIRSAWPGGALPHGAIRFVIKPHIDLLNPAHVAGLRETCLREGITVLVLDTWTALSPSADPLGTKEQTRLAQIVETLCADIDGLVIVVDHSRKNRPDGALLSSAEILGPSQKWQKAEHIIMQDVVAGGRLEVFLESKDAEGGRFFLARSPEGSGTEKFTYAGTVAEIADAQRAVGDQNRQAVRQAVASSDVPLSRDEVGRRLLAQDLKLSPETVKKHLAALVGSGVLRSVGKGKATRYAVTVNPPSSPIAYPIQEGLYESHT